MFCADWAVGNVCSFLVICCEGLACFLPIMGRQVCFWVCSLLIIPVFHSLSCSIITIPSAHVTDVCILSGMLYAITSTYIQLKFFLAINSL